MLAQEGKLDMKIKKEKTLLEKYDIPIDRLDFAFIQKCENVKELEKIIKILRSKEEGYFPDLLRKAEEKLKVIDPNNRLLRIDAPIVTKDFLSKEEWKFLSEDLEDWNRNISNKEMVMNNASKSIQSYPDVRKSSVGLQKNIMEERIKKPNKRISAFDYSSWDKFDADVECTKIDLEEKKKEAEKELKESEEKKAKKKLNYDDLIEKTLNEIEGTIDNMTQEEKEIMAAREKDIGNEFYNANSLKEALRHYTRSIYINPTCSGYNNRAATYLKLFKFNRALEDLDKALSFNPNDVKALYRRAVALQHKNKFEEAFTDVRKALMINPQNLAASHLAEQLRENCASLPKKYKIKITEKDHPDENKIISVSFGEMTTDYKDVNFVEVNDWGLPKVMCNCNNKYSSEPGYVQEKRRLQRLQQAPKKQPETEKAPKKQPENDKSQKKIEIVELEKIEEEKPEEKHHTCIVEDKRPKSKIVENNPKPPPEPKKLKIVSFSKNKNENDKFYKNVFDTENTNKTEKNTKNDKTAKNIHLQDKFDGDKLENDEINVNRLSNLEILEIFKSKNLAKLEKVLRSLSPTKISAAIGLSLDVSILINAFSCIYNRFDHKSEVDLMKKQCEEITKLVRFSIVSSLMSSEEKKIMDELEQIVGPFVQHK